MARVPMGKSEDLRPEITDHPAYNGLKLKLLIANDTEKFDICNGCMEAGAGTSYIVEGGGRLHICCAVKPDDKINNLEFCPTPPKRREGGRKLCDGSPCRHARKKGPEKAVNGFVYYDRGRERYYHPCCVGTCLCTPPAGNNKSTPIAKHSSKRGKGLGTSSKVVK